MINDADKQLLTDAAAVMGYRIITIQHNKIHVAAPGGINFHWNPLVDDGDAFRLAVTLQLPLDYASAFQFEDGPLTKCSSYWDPRESCYRPFIQLHQGNPLAATRRAIVKAAAHIGKRHHD